MHNLFSRLNWYALVVFLSSAIVMILELAAGRLLAPYLGVSLYTWTSIIGVVLAGLSLGNYLGGIWADSGANDKSAGLSLVLAGLFAIASLYLLTLIAPLLQMSGINLLSASFLYMLGLFFIPATLLGVILPLITTLSLRLDARSGHVVGRMHALGALGGILGTFISGYWLIQYFGTRATILGSGIVLLCLAAPFFLSRTVSAIILVVASTGFGLGKDHIANPCEVESNYFCLRAVDVSRQVPSGEATALVLDHLMHGINHKQNPQLLISPYVHLMDELPERHFANEREPEKFFFAGGGAYTQPRALQTRNPDSEIVVAEVDPMVTDFAKNKLYLQANSMQLLHQDARRALTRMPDNKFDVIVSDVFHDISVPYHLLTLEYAKINKAKLKIDGLFLANLVDIYPEPRLVKAFAKTLQTEFKYVSIWLDHIPDAAGRKTYVIAANNLKSLPNSLRSRRGLDVIWFNVSQDILPKDASADDIPILTDDFVPVERLISPLLFSELGS